MIHLEVAKEEESEEGQLIFRGSYPKTRQPGFQSSRKSYNLG
jgi:hypothetical protein